MLASAVMDRSRSSLNDVAGDLYTNDFLLPFLQNAWDDLQSELQVHGLPATTQQSVALAVTAGATSVSPLPSTFIEPITLYERKDSTEDWVPMREVKSLITQGEPTDTLGTWCFVDEELQVHASNMDREVLIEFTGTLVEISGANTNLPLNGALLCLAYKTAAEAAEAMGNRTRSDRLESKAEVEKSKFIKTRIKGSQGLTVRRIPYTRRIKCPSPSPY